MNLKTDYEYEVKLPLIETYNENRSMLDFVPHDKSIVTSVQESLPYVDNRGLREQLEQLVDKSMGFGSAKSVIKLRKQIVI